MTQTVTADVDAKSQCLYEEPPRCGPRERNSERNKDLHEQLTKARQDAIQNANAADEARRLRKILNYQRGPEPDGRTSYVPLLTQTWPDNEFRLIPFQFQVIPIRFRFCAAAYTSMTWRSLSALGSSIMTPRAAASESAISKGFPLSIAFRIFRTSSGLPMDATRLRDVQTPTFGLRGSRLLTLVKMLFGQPAIAVTT